MKYKILKYFASIKKIWAIAAIREIQILEMENESQFVKYTTLENNHLYGTAPPQDTCLAMPYFINVYRLKFSCSFFSVTPPRGVTDGEEEGPGRLATNSGCWKNNS